jgi:gas vesicle protein
MSTPLKDQLKADLEKAKGEGKLRADRIREIVQSAVSQASAEAKEGSTEIRSLVKETLSIVIETLKERGGEIKEEVTASVEGVIKGISSSRRQSIAKTQEEVKQLQAQLDSEETELQVQIDNVLSDIEEAGKDTTPSIRTSLESAIDSLKDSEEVALMRKRYAQLQTQLAVLRANLAARYGEREDEVKIHLDDAKTWYDRAQIQAETTADTVKQKGAEFENKLGEAGAALARKEQRVRQLLKELWQTVTESPREK